MTRSLHVTASVLALSLLPVQGWALTAQETWENWQQQAEASGQTMTVEGETEAGGVLTLTGMAFSSEMQDGTLSGRLEQVVMTENSDGTVTMTFSPDYDMTMAMTPEFGETVTVAMKVSQPDATVIASDAGEAVSYVFTAPTLTVEPTEIKVGDEVAPFEMTFSLTNTAGQYSISKATPVELVSNFTISALSMDMKGEDPDTNANFTGGGEMKDITFISTSTNGSLFGTSDLPTMLKNGLAGTGKMTYGPSTISIDVAEAAQTFNMDLTSEGGSADFAINPDEISYEVIYDVLKVALQSSDIPIPQVDASWNSLTTNVVMPIAESEEPQPFRVKIDMDQLTLGDPVWNMFDPATVLPRTPAKLLIDLTGQGNWLMDILDPSLDPSAVPAGPPGELHALDLDALQVNVAGAELTGGGSFTFDNEDLQTFDGMPRPEGSANFTLVGANALLDKLVQMGLVPQDQALGVRMMSGMAFRPGEGEDTLLSEIVVAPNGEVTANGNILMPGK
ncbi:DUF2125 domain-containing protein [Actibacterium sp. 188UL27-1]|uniref:DUF2125 domain-containing protein n=1 Tax=Actibacterium sp. 188UL27-1 TaxID=2786961 RepID=UPI001958C76E|nr:DUF2125 domain-containing protein [Actibacterium sp. 188UL27-1]MBM7070143.1 DUF2125 domain-containing protein [Actibacterium sp. 188UL27-1]